MQIVICEDNHQIVKEMESLIAEVFQECRVPYFCETYFSGEKLVHHLKRNEDYKTELYILDIEMKELDGMQVASYIREKDKQSLIIFATSHDEFMQGAFDVSAFHFLVKPIDRGKFRTVLKKAIETMEIKNEVFRFTKNRNYYSIAYDDIEIFESSGRKINIYTHNSVHSFNGILRDVAVHLPRTFYRVHASYIVNMEYVNTVEGRVLTMNSGEVLTISRSYFRNFNQAFRTYVMNRLR